MAALIAGTLWVSTIVGERLSATHATGLAGNRGWLVPLCIIGCALARRVPARCIFVVVCGLSGGAAAWYGVTLPPRGQCGGVAILVKDPVPMGRGVSVIVRLDGDRYQLTAHGSSAARIGARLAGESLLVEGRCGPTSDGAARYARISHVVGTIVPSRVSEEFSVGSMATRASNRLRKALARGVSSMPAAQRSLFMGLVIGDDRDQPRSMIEQFRGSGLSHLCAVSGQNVSYLLAAMSPLLRRKRRLVRWMLTLGVIAWFSMLTRGEPSVLRAGVMAAVVATNAAAGVALNARVVVSITVSALLVADPMLAWSVGFALSVGATAGLAWLSAPMAKFVRVPHLGRRIRGLNEVVCATLAAQVGTMPVSLAVFGWVPAVSVITNPLAIGVAGAVMMFGLPVALVASVLPPLEPFVSALMTVPVGWVGLVARTGATVGPTGALNWGAWVAVTAAIARSWRRSRHKDEPSPTDVGTLSRWPSG